MRSEKHLKVHSEEMNWSVPAWLWPISRKRDLWVERMPKNQQIAMSYSTISHTVQTNGWGKKIFNKKNFKIYLLKEKYSALKMLSNYWIIWGNTLKFNENHDIMPHCGYNFVKIVYMQRKKVWDEAHTDANNSISVWWESKWYLPSSLFSIF